MHSIMTIHNLQYQGIFGIKDVQDVLGLGADARINTPGTTGPHNWSWRVRQDALNPDVSGRLKHITRTYRRG